MKLRTVLLDQTVVYTHSRSKKHFIHPAKTRAPLPYYKSHTVNNHLLSEAKNTHELALSDHACLALGDGAALPT